MYKKKKKKVSHYRFNTIVNLYVSIALNLRSFMSPFTQLETHVSM